MTNGSHHHWTITSRSLFLRLPAIVSEHSVNPIQVRRRPVVGARVGGVTSGHGAADHPRGSTENMPAKSGVGILKTCYILRKDGA